MGAGLRHRVELEPRAPELLEQVVRCSKGLANLDMEAD